MADKTVDEKSVLKQLEPFAKTLEKTATQLWRMFTMRYMAKGFAEVFLALFINLIGFLYLWPDLKYWTLIPLGFGGVLIYDAIQLIANPQYFALSDVLFRLKNENLFKDK